MLPAEHAPCSSCCSAARSSQRPVCYRKMHVRGHCREGPAIHWTCWAVHLSVQACLGQTVTLQGPKASRALLRTLVRCNTTLPHQRSLLRCVSGFASFRLLTSKLGGARERTPHVAWPAGQCTCSALPFLPCRTSR